MNDNVAAIVLAGGMSTRMGAPKPLAMLGGRMLIERVLDTLMASGSVAPIVVVTGHLADQLDPILRGLPVVVAHNVDYEKGGMLSSIKTGIRALPTNSKAVLLALCDQPMVQPATVSALVSDWRARRPRVLVPTHQGKRGHPIILSAVGFSEISSLAGDATLKSYTSAHAAEILELEVEDAAVTRDIDTPADLAAEQKSNFHQH